MELTLVGLQNSGKTTLVNVIAVRLEDKAYSQYISQLMCCHINIIHI